MALEKRTTRKVARGAAGAGLARRTPAFTCCVGAASTSRSRTSRPATGIRSEVRQFAVHSNGATRFAGVLTRQVSVTP